LVKGPNAKTILALRTAGSDGLTPDAAAWSLHLASSIRDIRLIGLAIRTEKGLARMKTRTRYILECDPEIEQVEIRGRA
jgi:hypothetical protein